MDGVGKALSVVRRVGKATPKILGYALPAASIGVNALSAWKQHEGDLETAAGEFLLKYIPVNVDTGRFQTNHLKEGLGSLLVSMGVGKLLQWLGS